MFRIATTLFGLLGLVALLAGCPQQPEEPQVGEDTASAAPATGSGQLPVGRTGSVDAGGLKLASFSVKGMTCGDCSSAIEAKLIGMDGVKTVAADEKAGTARVQFDPGKIGEQELIAAIDALGFTASLAEPGTDTAAGAGEPHHG